MSATGGPLTFYMTAAEVRALAEVSELLEEVLASADVSRDGLRVLRALIDTCRVHAVRGASEGPAQ
jgi:hypothetical protein